MKPLRLACLGVAAAIGSVFGQQDSYPPAGLILAARATGYVFLESGAQTKPLARDDRVAAGSVVTTGDDSQAVLVCSNGGTIALAPGTILKVEKNAQEPFAGTPPVVSAQTEPSVSETRLVLVQGTIAGKVPALKAGSAFTVIVDGREFPVGRSVFRISRVAGGEVRAEVSPRNFSAEDDRQFERLLRR